METQVWTLVGLLGAMVLGSFGAFFYLGQKIETQGGRLDSRIESLDSRLTSRIDGLDARLTGRLDGLNARMDGLSLRVEQQGNLFADRLYELGTKLDEHLRWHAG